MGKEKTTSQTRDDVVIVNKLHCAICGKSLDGEAKYYNLNDPRFKCKACYHKS